jgi:integrase
VIPEPAIQVVPGAPELDWEYLALHGFRPSTLTLNFPLGELWHDIRSCRHPDCERPASFAPWLCVRCYRKYKDEFPDGDVETWLASGSEPPPERRLFGDHPCRVGCNRKGKGEGGLCVACRLLAAERGLTIDEYVATNPTPRVTFGTCRVRVCRRLANNWNPGLCGCHTWRWNKMGRETPEQRPPFEKWADEEANPAFTPVDQIDLGGLNDLCRLQVLYGYEKQLRGGGRLSPKQIKAGVVWLCRHDVADLRGADIPPGTPTTYLRTWRASLLLCDAQPETERRRTQIRLSVLNERYSGTVDLGDLHAPWLVHLAQEQIWSLAAANRSINALTNVGIAIRWFAKFLRDEWPDEGRHPQGIGRAGAIAFLSWLRRRVDDTLELKRLPAGDPLRIRYEQRLLAAVNPPMGKPTFLTVTPVRYSQLVSTLKFTFNDRRDWLVQLGAGKLYITNEDAGTRLGGDELPQWEELGRSEDALPEVVFLRLLTEANLGVLPAGPTRNLIELHMRLGRRPWETRHLRFNCVQWDHVDIIADGAVTDRRAYPFVTYWMQKVTRRHVLPIHDADAAVIERQRAWLRENVPAWFDDAGNPRNPEMLLFPTLRKMLKNQDGTVPFHGFSAQMTRWLAKLPDIEDEDGTPFDRARVFPYAFRHTFAQLRSDAGVDLDVLQALMGHKFASSTQVYYRVSIPRRVEAARAIASRYRFDIDGNAVVTQDRDASDLARIRAGVGTVPVPGGACHEMNNVRADGHGCPIFYRCFSCRYFSTDFTQVNELRQLQAQKGEQLAALEAGYGTVFRKGKLADANMTLLREEITQLADLIRKCDIDLQSLTDTDRETVERWLSSVDRYTVVIPVEALKAKQQRIDQPTVDPAIPVEMGRLATAAFDSTRDA